MLVKIAILELHQTDVEFVRNTVHRRKPPLCVIGDHRAEQSALVAFDHRGGGGVEEGGGQAEVIGD